MVPASVCICVRKLIYQNQPRLCLYCLIKIKLLHRSTIMFRIKRRKQLQAIQSGPGLRMSI